MRLSCCSTRARGSTIATGNGRTALHISARKNHSKFCKLLLSRGASLDARDNADNIPEAYAPTTTADFLAAVRAAGGWLPYINAPRKELLALRQRLPALRARGRAAPSSSVRAHERLFLDAPGDVFGHVLAFWRSDRDDVPARSMSTQDSAAMPTWMVD
ncbi:hypothetical protein JL720_2283 [Aureococcus anophagefferens]|nr:hypothetical protein JL720_2283 [Aureococcus anophagefferens]